MVIDRAVEHLAAMRTDYVYDRSFRILTAVRDGSSVRPLDPGDRDQFLAEASLGQMSLQAAFAHLTSLEPRLATLADSVARPTKHDVDGQLRHLEVVHRLVDKARLVGPRTPAADPLLRTALARKVVLDYLRIKHDATARDDDTPVFAR